MFKYLCCLLLFGFITAYPIIRNVPGQYSTIQSAINASQNGDTVLVAEGVYFENINFRGKNITVASTFIINGNRQSILNTIINGSNPVHPDTASCVLIVSGEDSTAVLEGFTLTEGKGSKWIDEHGAGTFVEGGGILITLSSPTIKNNFIINNEAITRPAGTLSAGGGGIRVGDGAARIINNVIMKNKGMYGGGIVLNYCSGTIIKNNIIAGNSVDQYVLSAVTFGGGGLWVSQKKPGDPRANIIENNTIAGNTSFGSGSGQAGSGGGMWTGAAIVNFLNNIVWGNYQLNGKQLSGNASYTYNNVQDGIAGTGNISLEPAFSDSSFFLSASSPNIDAGDPAVIYNDPGTGGSATFPSMGTLRNDIGAYGGPARSLFPEFSSAGLYTSSASLDFGNIFPGNSKTLSLQIFNTGSEDLVINSFSSSAPDVTILTAAPLVIEPLKSDSVTVKWTPVQNYILDDSMLINHNDPYLENPFKIILNGNSNPIPVFQVNTSLLSIDTLDVNIPVFDTSFYVYNTGTGPDSVYTSIDYNGVTPSNALSVEPSAFQIAAGDSQLITFTIYPPLVERNTADLYSPRIIFDARFSPGTTHFIKPVRFRLKGILTGVDDPAAGYSYRLDQNYPNPFNPVTIIRYEIPAAGKVLLKIYNIIGIEVAVLVDEEQPAGVHQVQFTAADHRSGNKLASGIYFYKLETEGFTAFRKMILLK